MSHMKKAMEHMGKHHDGMKKVKGHPHMGHEEKDHGASVAHEKPHHKKTAHKKAHHAKKHHKKEK